MPARIYAPAEARLLEIWDYTLEKWGAAQADRYVRTLIEFLHSLGSQRDRWRAIQDRTLVGVWFVRHEHHFVFFRQLSNGEIGVITILHEKMDLPARLREDSRIADAS